MGAVYRQFSTLLDTTGKIVADEVDGKAGNTLLFSCTTPP
jgi:hypothetical protein